MAISQLQEFTNNATTTVPATISNVATSITVATGTGALFPVLAGSEYFIATIVNITPGDPGYGQIEIVKATARSGDVITIVRAQEATTAKSFPTNSLFELRPTAGAFDTIYTNILQVQTDKADLASPVFTGNPTAPTPSSGDDDTSIATTAFVNDRVDGTNGFAKGALMGIQVLTTSGNYTPTTGTTSIVFHLVGGGGAGGGAAATGAGQASVGGGGASGGYCVGRETSGFSGAAYTIGAGGTGVSGAAGNSGGNSTFLGATASGGAGGFRDGPAGTPFANSIGALGGAATGGNLLNIRGDAGTCGVALTSASTIGVLSGAGGSGFFGTGGRQIDGGQAAGTSSGFGAGGGGEANAQSAGAVSGGAGGAGVLIIYEYA